MANILVLMNYAVNWVFIHNILVLILQLKMVVPRRNTDILLKLGLPYWLKHLFLASFGGTLSSLPRF